MTAAGATPTGGRPSAHRGTTAQRTPVHAAAALVGAMFVLVGILGFVPGITTHYGQMKFAGHTSNAMLLGTFCVSILHNVVHLLFGIVGLASARTAAGARSFLVAGGVIYLILFLYGLLVNEDSKANFVPINNADNILHLVLGLGMIALGAVLGRHAWGERA